MSPADSEMMSPAFRDDVARLSGASAGGSFLTSCKPVVNPLKLVWSACASGCRQRDRCDGRCEPADRGWRRHKSGRRTRRKATVSERLPPIVQVIDAAHPLY